MANYFCTVTKKKASVFLKLSGVNPNLETLSTVLKELRKTVELLFSV